MSDIKRVLVDATVEADMAVNLWRWKGEASDAFAERRAKELELACGEFHDHCRDHRSLDHIRLTVNRVYEYQCPCGNGFDTEAAAKACMVQDALEAQEIK